MKMKRNYLPLLYAFLGITALYYLIDFISGGVVLTIISDFFFYTSEYTDSLGILHQVIAPNWQRLKIAALMLLLVLAMIGCLIIRLTINKRKQENQLILEQMLMAFRDKQVLSQLPKEYAKIESILLQIRNQQENQIRMLELQTRQKNDLISYLAHDMKTPLASVIGYLNLLNDVKDVPQQLKERYIEITLDKANRLEMLIDEFFDITRFNLHDIVLTYGRLELSFMFQQLCEQFYPIMIKQDKQIVLEIDEKLMIYADADKLARAFNNILKNAISYSYDHTIIRINAQVDQEQLMLTIHNQGDEIPQQKLQTIFEKFYRLDAARSTNAGGAGLGLAIAKEIIEAHGGRITAQSNRQETQFCVMIPVDDRKEAVSCQEENK